MRSEHVNESHFWHLRYGHLNYNGLQLLKKKNPMSDLPSIYNQAGICERCVYQKMHRFPFLKTAWRANAPLQLVYANICGPTWTPSMSNKRYFLLFIDDYSRMIWIYFLDKKIKSFRCLSAIQNSCRKAKWVLNEDPKEISWRRVYLQAFSWFLQIERYSKATYYPIYSSAKWSCRKKE